MPGKSVLSGVIRLYLYIGTLFLLPAKIAYADWTGVNVVLEDTTSLWNTEGVEREASINRIILQLEEKTEAELRVGATIGQASVRSNDLTGPTNIQKFDASFIGLYLRQPIQLGEMFSARRRVRLSLSHWNW